MLTKAIIAQKLKMARQRQIPRRRQRDVDELVGVPYGRTAHYENGRAAPPHAYLVRVAQLWSIPVGWFLEENSIEPPGTGTSGSVGPPGSIAIAHRPDLPTGDWSDFDRTASIFVDAKFRMREAFGCFVDGDFLSPRIRHRDLLIFWPAERPKLGVLSFTAGFNGVAQLLIPVYDAGAGQTVLTFAGSSTVVEGNPQIAAVAVGLQRLEANGDQLVLFNPEGLRLSE